MRIIIVGCGRLGSEVANEMNHQGHNVTVVDKNPEAFQLLEPGFKGRTIEGIGFDRDVLVAAGVERADGLAAMTSGDNTNIITARVARKVFQVPNVVARLFNPRRAETYQRLGLPVVATTTWGVSRVIHLLAHSRITVAMTLGNGEAELVEIDLPEYWVGRAVEDVTVPNEVRVVTISRRGRTLIPIPGTLFEEKDRLLIAVLASSRRRLESMMAID